MSRLDPAQRHTLELGDSRATAIWPVSAPACDFIFVRCHLRMPDRYAAHAPKVYQAAFEQLLQDYPAGEHLYLLVGHTLSADGSESWVMCPVFDTDLVWHYLDVEDIALATGLSVQDLRALSERIKAQSPELLRTAS